ncbi:hypothetical protein CRG98_031483 [Punica granatum]|uniref:Integrase catalytic domain-containing protein n=1 Tax=Punica granatum TaxID=22663 RepID=A0A2I0IVT1_PUNGR|nr:hypothetical protein CRG98_031483 [Punica granatum]
MSGLMLAKKLMRLGYFWSTIEADCAKHVRRYHLCQVYADQIKAPPNELHPMAAPWPFSMWGIDVIGLINPKASNGHLFILVAIDYFIKWIEAITLASVTAKPGKLGRGRAVLAGCPRSPPAQEAPNRDFRDFRQIGRILNGKGDEIEIKWTENRPRRSAGGAQSYLPRPFRPSSPRPGARIVAPSLVAAAAPNPGRPLANGPRPSSFFFAGPTQAQPGPTPSPAQLLFRAVSPSGGRSDPI